MCPEPVGLPACSRPPSVPRTMPGGRRRDREPRATFPEHLPGITGGPFPARPQTAARQWEESQARPELALTDHECPGARSPTKRPGPAGNPTPGWARTRRRTTRDHLAGRRPGGPGGLRESLTPTCGKGPEGGVARGWNAAAVGPEPNEEGRGGGAEGGGTSLLEGRRGLVEGMAGSEGRALKEENGEAEEEEK